MPDYYRTLYRLTRPLLFRLDPERAHDRALGGLQRFRHLVPRQVVSAPVEVMGLTFTNPVGLAAGMDKNGDYLDGLGRLGFGFIELGTVTPRPQPGNPKPRLFRLPEAQALINRMGFNNRGMAYLLAQVARRRYAGIVGINIGKQATTPLDHAVDDYLSGLEQAYPLADYVTINISSPNTQGLRELQQQHALAGLLRPLKEAQTRLSDQYGRYVPLVVKVAPDLDAAAIDGIAGVLLAENMDGLIATNTTASRVGVTRLPHATQTGGLSGAPLTEQATAVVARFRQRLDGQLPIIASGGVMSAADAVAKYQAGAQLVQLYTGLVYHGPALVREVAMALQTTPAASIPTAST